MQEEMANKMINPERSKKGTHFYPDHGVVIEAESKEEADKILDEKLKKVIIKNK